MQHMQVNVIEGKRFGKVGLGACECRMTRREEGCGEKRRRKCEGEERAGVPCWVEGRGEQKKIAPSCKRAVG